MWLLFRGRRRLPMVACLFVAVLAGRRAAGQAPSPSPPPQHLGAGQVVERPIRGQEQHPGLVQLERGQYLEASIDPRDVHVKFVLTAPDGGTFSEEVPAGAGPKSIEWVAAVDGEHRLDVQST